MTTNMIEPRESLAPGVREDQAADGSRSAVTVAHGSDMLQQAYENALLAAALGYRVAPTVDKKPAIPSPHGRRRHGCRGQCGLPGHGVHDATTRTGRIRHLFQLAPWANGYLVACGSTLIGLDLDRRHGIDGCANLARLAERHGFAIPRTTTVFTPSGGMHIWLTVPDGTRVPNSAGTLAPGIDVRGTGGFLVGPGSHTSAGEYQFHPRAGYIPPAACPQALLDLLEA